MKIDEIDAKILRLLLEDARLKKTDIAKECGLSSTAIINRINSMKTSEPIIIKPVLSLNMASFGYSHPVLIGVNLSPNAEQHIIELINKNTIVAAIDRTVGRYDLCLFVFAKSLKDLDRLRNLVVSQKGVNKIEIHIWHEFQLNYSNINLISPKESESNGQA